MENQVIRPSSILFHDTSRFRFDDAVNTLRYATLMKKAGADNTKLSCLAPVCANPDQDIEDRKAAYVGLTLDMLNAGLSIDCIPDACNCEEFASGICQGDLIDQFKAP